MQSPLAFYLPKYWLTWLGLGALRGIEFWPYGAQRVFATVFGKVIERLPLRYVHIARRNIELCLPTLSPNERAALLTTHCQSLAMGVCETANTWWSGDAWVKASAQVVGIEHLNAAVARGRGVILIGGHFTTIQFATRILGTVIPLNMLYRAPKNPVLAKMMRAGFARHGNPIAHDDIRAMLRALKNNEAVWYAPDQSYRNKGAAMAKFFAIPAATTTATSRLAQISGAAVLPYFPERLPGTAGYRVVIGPALLDFPSGDVVQDAERFNALLEAHIRRIPEQYLWMHRRFKGLSTDYPDYYGRHSRNPKA